VRRELTNQLPGKPRGVLRVDAACLWGRVLPQAIEPVQVRANAEASPRARLSQSSTLRFDAD
jgi:hypothetical protein